jgi:protein-disulfide isomerase
MAGMQSPSGPMIVAAAIVGGAILAGSLLVQSGLSETSAQLEQIRVGLTETKDSLQALAKAQPRPQQQARRGPDPNKVHTINTKGAPAKGPGGAKVKIVEFSDFQ